MSTDSIVERQLEMNRVTFARLQELGLTAETLVRLDFAYVAPNKAAARGLAALLQSETDYRVEVVSNGQLFRKCWGLTGATEETAIDLQILDDWVKWMVTAGLKHGCDFDGWGTSL